jgi:hypothetical protein
MKNKNEIQNKKMIYKKEDETEIMQPRWYTIEIKAFSINNDVFFVARLAIFAYTNFDFALYNIFATTYFTEYCQLYMVTEADWV